MATLQEQVTTLREAIKASNANIESLSGALMQFAVHNDERATLLEQEIERQRKLQKWNRRTHFMTMGGMVFLTLLLGDIAHHAHSAWWDLLFWAWPHGSGAWDWVARGIGLFWQVSVLMVLVKRAQVPADFWPETAAAAVAREKAAQKTGMARFFDSRHS